MKLSENWSVEYDSRNVILVFTEPRTKVDKNGEKKEYDSRKEHYYGNLKQALKSYLLKSLHGAESIENCLQKIAEVENKIDDLAAGNGV